MSAIRLPLLCAFAGGCLSSAILFGLWRADANAGAPAAKQQRPPDVELIAAVVTATIAAANAEQRHDLVASAAAEHGPHGAGEPAPQAGQALDSGGPSSPGSAVSDVLASLETAYRAHVAATAPVRTSSTQERGASAPSDHAVAPTEASPVTAPQSIAAAIPVAPAPIAAAPIAAPAPVAPVAVVPAAVTPAVAVAPAAAPPQIAAVPAFVAQADSRPSEVHIGDLNQNTYITNVRQGDVYLIQMQQLAMLQYMQLLGASSGLVAPAHSVRGTGPRPAPFSSTITNPDNPWGFRFAPPNLVH